MLDFAALGYGLTAILFGSLSVLLVVGWRARYRNLLWVGALVATAVWAAMAAWYSLDNRVGLQLVWACEVLRDVFWVLFLLRLLQPLAEGNSRYYKSIRYALFGSLLLGVLLVLVILDFHVIRAYLPDSNLPGGFALIGQLLFALGGMATIEQLFRNTPPEQRWGIKYLCFGLSLIFAYDFYLYTDALLFHRTDMEIWSARGAVTAMAAPMLMITAARNPEWNLPVFLSRRAVFHTTTLFVAGLYMLVIALAGYYIKLYGGEWGTVLQIAFLFGALTLLATLLFSGELRARAKVFFNKHFFSYRYDYREEWLSLMSLLAGKESELPLHERVILAIGEIADSPGGLLWLRSQRGDYLCAACLNLPCEESLTIPCDHPAIQLMETEQWIIDLDEYRNFPASEKRINLPNWLVDEAQFWLMVPLMQDQSMLGFVLLAQPRVRQSLNWEGRDLLKTAGMQAASYIALYQAADALAEARQFEGFNRLSAFIVHDLKNLIAQLSLVARNAAKHKRNPQFIDDAVSTIENSVAKMNRLMVQLRSADAGGRNANEAVDLVKELSKLVETRQSAKPQPQLELHTQQAVVWAEGERLGAVFGHVLQNALDATPADGQVLIVLKNAGDHAVVEFRDTGSGMDEDFVKNRLFRPFDSTKGLTGMGIGAYECREVVRACGGQVVVNSQPGQGTVFGILLPL